jgi:hypothetical protein
LRKRNLHPAISQAALKKVLTFKRAKKSLGIRSLHAGPDARRPPGSFHDDCEVAKRGIAHDYDRPRLLGRYGRRSVDEDPLEVWRVTPRFRTIQISPKDLPAALRQITGAGVGRRE